MFKHGISRPEVWLVDDREENRTKFSSDHNSEFTVVLFSEPDDVLTAIRQGRMPDALVCDVYFYKDKEQREAIEKIVKDQISQLQEQASKFKPEQAEEGIGLMQSIHDQFAGDVPFPIFAYTSKGPYLLHTDSFDKIEDLGAKWLFKNKFSVQNERREVRSAINEFAERRYWSRRAWELAWKTGLIMAVFGSVLGIVLDRLARHFGF
jgi:CheY-like chemotaxis protein